MPKNRIEAISDGVIAVAITLLVLNLEVPDPGSPVGLAQQLLALWPELLAYVISFLSIGIIWINHHTMLRRLDAVDHSILILNVMLLMCIVLLPFSTSLLATYLDAPHGGRLAAAVYAGSFLLTSSVFLAMQHHVLTRRRQLPGERHGDREVRAILRRSALAIPAYLLAGVASLVSPYLTLAVCVAAGVFYLLRPPAERGRRGVAAARPEHS